MNGIARDAEQAHRLALALPLALGLHAALLLAIPADGWSLRPPRPLRFDLVLPPAERPEHPASPTPTALAPPEPTVPSDPGAAGVVPEPALPPPAFPPVPPSSPALTPPPTMPPPEPVAAALPAPKFVAPSVAPARPSVATTLTPLPPARPAKPARTAALPAPRKATTGQPSGQPPVVKPPPPPRLAPTEAFRPSSEKPPGRGGGAGTGASGRLDSTALLHQIAGLDAETQRRAGGDVRERRVSLADTRSLAGFYAADWARKVTRVGEMNFPDAARRLTPGTGPLLDVAIQADGSLRNVRVLRSSGNAELDQAARRIVQLAAPYPPFPPELRQQIELLHIEAPWRFDPRGQVQVR
jgi:protein TonB